MVWWVVLRTMYMYVCMYVCSCSTNQCSIVHSSTSWQRCETQVHFNDVVAPPAAEHGSGTDSCMYVCMYVSPFLWAWSCIVWLVQLKASTGARKGKIVVIENVGNLRLTCRSPGEKAVIEIMYKEIKGIWEFLYEKGDLADKGFAFLFNRVGKKFKCYWS